MKQFIVDRHTVPGTPSMDEVPNEKIPVYDSREDVTADLANLEVGQIVATKDTGSELSAPVDVVQNGNMHAVTSNAVAKNTPKVFIQFVILNTSGATSYTFDTTPYKSFVLTFEIYDQSLGGMFSFKFIKEENGTLITFYVSKPSNYLDFSETDGIITISMHIGQGGITGVLSGYVVEN